MTRAIEPTPGDRVHWFQGRTSFGTGIVILHLTASGDSRSLIAVHRAQVYTGHMVPIHTDRLRHGWDP